MGIEDQETKLNEMMLKDFGALNIGTDVICAILDAALGNIPTIVRKIGNFARSYQDIVLAKNLKQFIEDTSKIDKNKKQEILNKISEKSEEDVGAILMNLLSKLDNINKVKIISLLFHSLAQDEIDTEMFLRLSSVVERIPYVDLKHIEDFQKDNYVPCVAESLYSAGVIGLSVIDGGDAEGKGQDMYRITPIGYYLLKYGMTKDIDNKEVSKIKLPSAQYREDDFPFNVKEKLSDEEELILRNWCASGKPKTKVHYLAQGIDFRGGIRNENSYFTEVEWVRKWKPFFDKCIELGYVDQINEREYTLTNRAFEYIEQQQTK